MFTRFGRIPNPPAPALAILLAAVLGSVPAASAAADPANGGLPAMVILVRHAEPDPDSGDDPPLTLRGVARAQALAAALHEARVSAIITTSYRPAQETAEPLADSLGITPEIVSLGTGGDDTTSYAESMLGALRRHPGEVVLVVGHPNSIPVVIAALGGPQVPDICHHAYADLYVLVPGDQGPRLVRSQFGEPDPEDACDEHDETPVPRTGSDSPQQ